MSDTTGSWEEVDQAPPLAIGEIHLWHIRLDGCSPSASMTLSADEKARAEQYHFPAHRDRFISCRSQLRAILGQYIAQPPERIIFRYGPQGKPFLSKEASKYHVEFNVSHAGNHALIVIARERQVGVDIECVETQLEFENLADRFMSLQEADYVRGAPDKARAFYSCWTRKEAWLKAIGCGLSEPLSRFDGSPAIGRPTAEVSCEDFPRSVWTLHELDVARELIAVVAVEGAGDKSKRLLRSAKKL